jgi:hypothetical protein
MNRFLGLFILSIFFTACQQVEHKELSFLNKPGLDRGSTYFQRLYSKKDYNQSLLDCLPTDDGGMVICGSSISGEFVTPSFLYSPMVLKLNSSGKIVWQKKFIVTDGSAQLNSISKTSDGGFVMAGLGTILSGESVIYQLLVVRINGNGDVLFTKRYNMNDQISQGGEFITQTRDGGFAATSVVILGVSVHRLSSTGDVIWSRIYHRTDGQGSSSENIVRGISAIGDELMVTGASSISGSQGAGYLLKLDASSGTVLPSFIYVDENPEFSNTMQKLIANGSNLYVFSNRGGDYNAVLKLNYAGEVQSAKYFTNGGAPGIGMSLTPDGGLVFLSSAIGETSLAIAHKINASFNQDWVKSFNYTNVYIMGGGISPLRDGGYFIAANYNDVSAGVMGFDEILGIKLRNNGESCSAFDYSTSFQQYLVTRNNAEWNSQAGFTDVANGGINISSINHKRRTLCKSGDDNDEEEDDDDDCGDDKK